jgi:hypothetical protein
MPPAEGRAFCAGWPDKAQDAPRGMAERCSVKQALTLLDRALTDQAQNDRGENERLRHFKCVDLRHGQP